MRFRRFEIFKTIMEAPTLTEAASRLNLTQPAATKALRQLESELGLTLFDRQRGRLQPTSDAHDLYHYLEDVFHRVASLTSFVSERRELRRGHATIAVNAMFSTLLLPRLVEEFVRKYPGVTLAVQVHSSSRVNEMVENGLVNIGIATPTHETSAIRTVPLMNLTGVCVLPRHSPLAEKPRIAAADLLDQPFVSTSDLDKTRMLIDRFFGVETARRNIICEVSLAQDACMLVERGVGATIVNALTARDFEETCHVRPLDGEIDYEVSLLVGQSRPLTGAERALEEMVRERIGQFLSQALNRPPRRSS